MYTQLILMSVLLLAGAEAEAKPWWMRGVESNETDFLPPDVAFRAAASVDGETLRLRWVIADGYYLYRQKMSVAAESPDLTVGALMLPAGTVKTDAYLGSQEIYTHDVEGTATYRRSDYGAHPLQIRITYQGCAEAGLCYPPIVKVLSPASSAGPAGSGTPSRSAAPWELTAIGGGILAFLLAGLLLRKGRTLPLPAA